MGITRLCGQTLPRQRRGHEACRARGVDSCPYGLSPETIPSEYRDRSAGQPPYLYSGRGRTCLAARLWVRPVAGVDVFERAECFSLDLREPFGTPYLNVESMLHPSAL